MINSVALPKLSHAANLILVLFHSSVKFLFNANLFFFLSMGYNYSIFLLKMKGSSAKTRNKKKKSEKEEYLPCRLRGSFPRSIESSKILEGWKDQSFLSEEKDKEEE